MLPVDARVTSSVRDPWKYQRAEREIRQ
jgi:hypothetical protein